MGLASILQVDEMLGDFNRMNKRQVSAAPNARVLALFSKKKPAILSVAVPSAQLCDDCILCTDDLERSNGCHRQRIADCCGAERQHGAGFSSG